MRCFELALSCGRLTNRKVVESQPNRGKTICIPSIKIIFLRLFRALLTLVLDSSLTISNRCIQPSWRSMMRAAVQ